MHLSSTVGRILPDWKKPTKPQTRRPFWVRQAEDQAQRLLHSAKNHTTPGTYSQECDQHQEKPQHPTQQSWERRPISANSEQIWKDSGTLDPNHWESNSYPENHQKEVEPDTAPDRSNPNGRHITANVRNPLFPPKSFLLVFPTCHQKWANSHSGFPYMALPCG